MKELIKKYPRLMAVMEDWNSFKTFETILNPDCKTMFCKHSYPMQDGAMKAPRHLPEWVMKAILLRCGMTEFAIDKALT